MFENPTVNFNVLCISRAKIACCSSWVDLYVSLCGQQHPKCEPAIRLVPTFYMVNFALYLTSQTQILREVWRSKQLHAG